MSFIHSGQSIPKNEGIFNNELNRKSEWVRAAPEIKGSSLKVFCSPHGRSMWVWKFGNELKNLKNPDSLRTREAEEPRSWEIWQSLTRGIFYNWFECLNACPVGKRR